MMFYTEYVAHIIYKDKKMLFAMKLIMTLKNRATFARNLVFERENPKNQSE